MNPYFFGSSRSPLYGVHHPPRSASGSGGGVVLCNAFGQEYMRSHRAFRQLANLLARRGLHVLRFDYSATGDSAGASETADLGQWREDAGLAIDELRDAANLSRVALVGLRLGAAIAAQVAAAREDVEALVLWDPVVHGGTYLEEISAAAGVAVGAGSETVGITGFPLTARLRDGISAVDLAPLAPRPDVPLLFITGTERPDVRQLAERLSLAGGRVDQECIPTPGDWNEVDYFGSALVPQAIIRAIVDWLPGGIRSA